MVHGKTAILLGTVVLTASCARIFNPGANGVAPTVFAPKPAPQIAAASAATTTAAARPAEGKGLRLALLKRTVRQVPVSGRVATPQPAAAEQPVDIATVTTRAAPLAAELATVEPPPLRKTRARKPLLPLQLARLTPRAEATGGSAVCGRDLLADVPRRPPGAEGGSAVLKRAMSAGGSERDRMIEAEILRGNIPPFLWQLTPVTMTGTDPAGVPVAVTICVTPDYLAVGNDRDFVRVPLGLPAAASVASRLGFLLPTTKMVDAIYQQAALRLAPSPMQAGRQMSSTDYLLRHNGTVQAQLAAAGATPGQLVAGQKKDIVLTNALRRARGRVAIYGWHRTNGLPIQPLSTVHGQSYADYSHGIRLVARTAYVNGKPRPLAELLEDPRMAAALSKEGPIRAPAGLLVALAR